jgi:lanthanide-dependent methanol dehydrogenase
VDDGQWVMAPKNYASTRFSGLTEITTENVGNLQLAWTFSTGVLRGHEAAPLVVGDTMYVVTPYPNILYALDLNAPAGRVKWKYEPEAGRAAQGVACCDVVNRGAAYADGKISSTPSTTTPWRSTRARAARSGRRSSATSTSASR